MISINSQMPKGAFSLYNKVLPFPETIRTVFVYDASNLMSSDASGSTLFGASAEFRLNAPYDPYTGIAGAFNRGCGGFNQLLAATGPYTRYKVNGCLVDIIGQDPFGSDAVGVDSTEFGVALYNTNDVATLAGLVPDDIESRPYGMIKRISGTGSQIIHIKQYVPMYQPFGWSKLQFDGDKDSTTAPYNNVPASCPYISIAVANRRGPTVATQLTVRVRLTFYCELYDRIISTPS